MTGDGMMSGSGSGSGSGTSRHNERAKAAILLARLGWRVFPLGYRKKLPLSKLKMGLGPEERGGFYCGTTDEKKIIAWATSHTFQNCNWGCWPDDLTVVIDVDLLDDGSPNPNIPQEVAYELAKAGAITITPSGGRHYWFRQPEPNRWRGVNGATKDKLELPSHIDIKTSTGLVVLPPAEVARKHGSGFGEYAWAPDYELTVSPAELPVTPPAVAEWLDSILGVTPESERVPSGDPKPIVISDPIPGFTEGTVEDYISSSTHWQKAALDLFIESEGVTKQWSSGEVIYFQRPGSKHPFGALWNAPGGRHGASGDAIRPLYYPRLGIGSSKWLRLSNTRDGKRAKNSFRAYSAAEIIRAYTPAAEMPELEKRWRKEHITQRRMKQVEEAGREWVADMAEWSEILWEGWLVEHHPHVRDCERIANELDGGMAVYEEEEAPEPKAMTQEQDQPTAKPGQEASAKADEASPGAGEPETATPTKAKTSGLCGEFSLKRLGLNSSAIYDQFMSRVRKGGIIERTAHAVQLAELVPQPLFRIAIGLTTISMAVGAKVQHPAGFLANLNILQLAESCEGKEAGKRVLRGIDKATAPCQMTENDDGTQEVTVCTATANIPHSDSGLIALLRERSPRILLQDEFSTWMAIARAQGGSYQEKVLRILTDLVTHGRGSFDVAAYAKPEDKRRGQPLPATPFCGIHAIGQPGILFKSLTADDIHSGLLGRIILVPGDDDGVPEHMPREPVFRASNHKGLIEQVAAWRQWQPDGCDSAGESIDDDQYLTFAWGPGAEEYAFDSYLANQRLWREGRASNDISSVVHSRYAEAMNRLALIIAIDSLSSPSGLSAINRPVLTIDHLHTAEILLKVSSEMLRRQAARHIASSPEDLFRMRAREWLEETIDTPQHRGKGIPRSAFCRRFHRVDKRLRDTILSDLISIGFSLVKVAHKTAIIELIRRAS